MELNLIILTSKQKLKTIYILALESDLVQNYFCIQSNIAYLISEKQHNRIH